jgi:plasmid stabilization system protein ParE
MARVRWSRRASANLRELVRFLARNSPAAAPRATKAILDGVRQLRAFPASGRPVEDTIDGTRDLIVPFGDGGYVIRYVLSAEEVAIMAIKHTRQAGF